jgi:hypothetical protein
MPPQVPERFFNNILYVYRRGRRTANTPQFLPPSHLGANLPSASGSVGGLADRRKVRRARGFLGFWQVFGLAKHGWVPVHPCSAIVRDLIKPRVSSGPLAELAHRMNQTARKSHR